MLTIDFAKFSSMWPCRNDAHSCLSSRYHALILFSWPALIVKGLTVEGAWGRGRDGAKLLGGENSARAAVRVPRATFIVARGTG